MNMARAANLGWSAQPPLLLAPTEALLRGFVFDDTAPEQALRTPAADSAAADKILLREGFRIGELRLMIRYEDGSELTDMPQVYLLPRAPAWFLGMANLHGALVPVFDPAVLFGVAHDEAAKPMFLVLGHGEDRAGIVIDGLPQRLRIAATERIDNAAVPPLLAGCVDQVYWIDGLDWMDLRVDDLLQAVTDQLAANAH